VGWCGHQWAEIISGEIFGSAQCETGVGLGAKTTVLLGKQSTQAQGCSAAAPHGKAVNGCQSRGDWDGREEPRPHEERGASVSSGAAAREVRGGRAQGRVHRGLKMSGLV